MKSKKNFIKIAILSTVFALGASIVSFKGGEKPATNVHAEQHLNNYDPYTYSGSYYDTIDFDLDDGMNGSLRKALTPLIVPEDFYSYSGQGENKLATQLQYADEDPTNSSNMVYLYTRDSVTKNSAQSWNREHVWCQSLSNGNWGETKGGTDILHLRPTYGSVNSSRGNKPYADLNKQGAKYYDGMLYGYANNTYFEPIDSVKGDVARIVMYLWVAYKDYPNYNDLNILKVFQSYDTLLRWHTLDKPDVLEGNRNDYSETSKQKNRNPFVDHPELGWRIFGDQASSAVKNACMEAYPSQGQGGGGGGQDDSTLLTFSVADYATQNSVASGTKVSSIVLDEHVTLEAVGTDSFTGKIYIGTSYTEWRFYTSGSGTLRITVDDGYELISANGQVATSNYGEPDSVSFDIVNNKVEYNPGSNFNIKSLEVRYKQLPVEPTAEEKVQDTKTRSSLSYTYDKTGDIVTDEFTGQIIGVSGTNYTDWSDLSLSSHAVYAGQSAGDYGSIQMRSNNSNSGIITTSSGGNAQQITVSWNSNTQAGRTLNIYGKDTAYTSPTELYNESTQGTKIGTIVKGTSESLTISGDYAYIGIRSNSGALYLDSLHIQWGDVAFTYPNISLRFGGIISKTIWEDLTDIQGFGVLCSTDEHLGDERLIDKYNVNDDPLVKKFYNEYDPLSADPAASPKLYLNSTYNGVEDDYYVWNLRKIISESDITTDYVAVAFIVTEGGVIFFKQTKASAKSLAQSMINSDSYTSSSYEGSLANMANIGD